MHQNRTIVLCEFFKNFVKKAFFNLFNYSIGFKWSFIHICKSRGD